MRLPPTQQTCSRMLQPGISIFCTVAYNIAVHERQSLAGLPGGWSVGRTVRNRFAAPETQRPLVQLRYIAVWGIWIHFLDNVCREGTERHSESKAVAFVVHRSRDHCRCRSCVSIIHAEKRCKPFQALPEVQGMVSHQLFLEKRPFASYSLLSPHVEDMSGRLCQKPDRQSQQPPELVSGSCLHGWVLIQEVNQMLLQGGTLNIFQHPR